MVHSKSCCSPSSRGRTRKKREGKKKCSGRMMGEGWDGPSEWKEGRRRGELAIQRVAWRVLAYMLSAAFLWQSVCVCVCVCVCEREREQVRWEQTWREQERNREWELLSFCTVFVWKRAEGEGESIGNDEKRDERSTALIILQSNSLLAVLKTPLVLLSFHYLPAVVYSALQWAFNDR